VGGGDLNTESKSGSAKENDSARPKPPPEEHEGQRSLTFYRDFTRTQKNLLSWVFFQSKKRDTKKRQKALKVEISTAQEGKIGPNV